MEGKVLARLNILGLGVSAAIVVIWQFSVSVRLIDFEYLPPPTQVLTSLVDLLSTGSTYASLFYTLSVTVIASVLALCIGFVLGAAVGLMPNFYAWTMGTFDVLRTLPMIGLMPVALLLMGATIKSEIVLATVGATWPFLINTMGGVRSTHPRLLEVAHMFRFSRMTTVRKIVIPSSIPAVLVGARLAVVTAFVVAIVAEMLVSAKGLGWDILLAQSALDPGRVWAFALIAGVLGYLLNLALVQGVDRAMPQLNAATEQAVGA